MKTPFEVQCVNAGLPKPIREWRFHPERKWRCDYAWPDLQIVVETEGGVFAKGGSRHSRGAGFREDTEKYAELFARGVFVLRVLPEQIRSGAAVQWVVRHFQRRLSHV